MFIARTTYTLRIFYAGDINRELYGFYMNHYIDSSGNKSMFMTSGMEPTSARSVLPCIDEPARKAIFKMSVVHDPLYTPWSNGEIERRETLSDGRIISYFTPTLQMSTFLLALIVAPTADFACLPDRVVGSKNTKSRVCGRTNILSQLTYADEVAYKTLEFFNTYFNIDYPLPKIEHFDVINFPGEAMENYGLLIYDDLGIFFDEKIVSSSIKQYITTLVVHEIAHQWLGNLVTPAWWNELWLKEGFATYMETMASSYVQPSLMLEEQVPVEMIFKFMEADSLPTSRPLSIESANLTDIIPLYDSISYYKGAAVIRMMSMILGARIFQEGLQLYVTALNFSSATEKDLWRYLNEAANNTINIQQVMDGWTRQAGYPVVEINRIYSTSDQEGVGSYMMISQKPFSLLPATNIERHPWWIPFKYFDRTFNQVNEILWFNNTSATLSITTSNSDWILANPDYLGIYRTKYDSQNFRLILNQLQSNHTHIPTASRAALIDDIFALSRAALANITDAYELIRYLKNETALVPWTIALAAMNQQELLLGAHDILADVQQYFLELILPIYDQIGWIPVNQSTEWLRALLQPNILSTVCRYGHQSCIDVARSLYQNWTMNPTLNPIPADLRLTVYCTVARTGSRSEFSFLWARLQNESIMSEASNLLEGLSCTQDPALILWFLNKHLENESIIRNQNLISSISKIARSPQANQVVWNWIRDNWPKLFSKWGKSGSGLKRIIDAVSSRFVTTRQRDEFKAFADTIVDKGKNQFLSYYFSKHQCHCI
ncbi:unnamed protein product [Adineta steineri]|uniref:Aminopeptidase n=1 Tax=Adineta steineri TaxID=433720 RepID=A0A819Q4H9_9BILA|nr:unnamed protein product [Adineta steineri]